MAQFTVQVGLLAGPQNTENYTFGESVKKVFDGTPADRFDVQRDRQPNRIEILPGIKMWYGKRWRSGTLGLGDIDIDVPAQNRQDWEQLRPQLLKAGWS